MKFTHYNRFFLKRNRLGSFINILNITKHKFCVLVWFIFVSLTDFMRNNSPYMAAGMAYWTLFSLFPLALAGISIIGYFFSTPSEQEIVVDSVMSILPVSKEYLSNVVSDTLSRRGTLGLLGTVGLLWTGASMFAAMRKSVAHVWRIAKPQNIFIQRGTDLLMIVTLGFILFWRVLVNIEIFDLSNIFGINGIGTSADSYLYLGQLSAFILTWTALLLIYKYIPNTTVYWQDIWLPSLVATILFELVQRGYIWFLNNAVEINLVYGSMAAIISVLLWAYLSSLCIILGSQFAFIHACVYGSRKGYIKIPQQDFVDLIWIRCSSWCIRIYNFKK